MVSTRGEYLYPATLLRAMIAVNAEQRGAVVRKLQQGLGRQRVELLGLAFKPGTDDLRYAPALDLAARLLRAGALVSAYDPVVKTLPDSWTQVRLGSDPYDAAERADAVVLVTEWPELLHVDPGRLAAVMRGRLLLDVRSALDPGPFRVAGLRVAGGGS